MTETSTGFLAADLAVDATGLLAEFNQAGLIGVADLHAADRLADLWEEPDERVRLAIALLVRSLRGGSVCLDITRMTQLVLDTEEVTGEVTWPEPQGWAEAVRSSPLVQPGAEGDDGRPVRLVGDLLYLERYWEHEEIVRRQLTDRQLHPALLGDLTVVRRELDALFDGSDLPADEPDEQRLAAAMAALSPVTVVAGGPGTGKTTTVARILALLATVCPEPPTVALAAPTGKAAARLEEAVHSAARALGEPWTTRIGEPGARTIHRLLGWRPQQRTRFRHNRDHPLPYDVVVVDEMSMVSLTLMARLLEALRPEARLILVGDPDQLASVEAGAVLADITRARIAPHPALSVQLDRVAAGDRPAAEPTAAGVVTLRHTWRFDGGIDRLARAIRAGDADAALAALEARSGDVTFTPTGEGPVSESELLPVSREVIASGRALHRAALDGDIERALKALDRHRVLCAHRGGPFGVSSWGRLVLDWLRSSIDGYAAEGDWYPGLPLLVTANDPDTGLYNGDTGVLVNTPRGPRAAFARGGSPTLYATIQLDSVAPVHAMTVHKAQGSQFQRLTVVLPPVESPLLTRELLYTAVTRASQHVQVIGSPEAIRKAVERPANRASGLALRLT